MKKIILLKGLPASGKSTWSRQFILDNKCAYKRVNKDDLRDMIDAGHFSRSNEQFVLEVRDFIVNKALDDGKHVIIDDTNFHEKHEAHMKDIAQSRSDRVVVEVKFFEATPEECIERDLKRPNSVGAKVIWDMYNKFLKPKNESNAGSWMALPQDPERPKAIICDLDGTLAILHRSPYAGQLCETDELNPAVAVVVKRFSDSHKIILLSGRDSKHMPHTKRWLEKHGIVYHDLFMRETGDSRNDSIIKRELFERHIRGRFSVEFVLDDRLRVCKLWYELGLHLLRYGDPEADF